jgi:hypothetical protein
MPVGQTKTERNQVNEWREQIGGHRPPLQTRRSVEFALTQVKKEREAKRNADEQGGDDGQPEARYGQTPAFRCDEHEEDDRRYDDVQSEERADTSGEQFLTEERNVQAVFDDPRQEFPVGEDGTDDAENQINVAQSHGSELKPKERRFEIAD